MLKGVGMPSFKSAVTLRILLLLTLVIYESVSAQSEAPKIEVGVQISGLAGGRFGDQEGVGGVAELYPSKRVVVRLAVGDTIANRQEPTFFISQPIFNSQAPPILVPSGFFAAPGRDFTTHYLQLSAGVGFRF
jgi:hypothetical protein